MCLVQERRGKTNRRDIAILPGVKILSLPAAISNTKFLNIPGKGKVNIKQCGKNGRELSGMNLSAIVSVEHLFYSANLGDIFQ